MFKKLFTNISRLSKPFLRARYAAMMLKVPINPNQPIGDVYM